MILLYLNHEIEKEGTVSEMKREGEKWFAVELWQMQRNEWSLLGGKRGEICVKRTIFQSREYPAGTSLQSPKNR